jgi:hypothetical protein
MVKKLSRLGGVFEPAGRTRNTLKSVTFCYISEFSRPATEKKELLPRMKTDGHG